jgi:3-hydroxyacyl-CoA dehydrogenase
VLNYYLPGFLMNRMQVALIREAINLVERGAASVEDVDAVVRDGMGLRWALMGPFGVANTNADGGVREYFNRYKSTFLFLMNDLGSTPSFAPEMIERIARGVDEMAGNIPRADIGSWRDRMIRKIRRIKDASPLK